MTNAIITARPYAGETDLQAIADLLNLCDRVDKLDDNYSVEDLRIEFGAPELDAARDLRLWEDDGQLIVFAETHRRAAQAEDTVADGYLYMRIHPDYRSAELEDEIMAWGEARMREVGRERNLPAELRSGGPVHYTSMLTVLERHGMKPARYFLRMVRDLAEPIAEPQFADGYTLRTIASAEDEERWVDAYNWSFIDHYNFHPHTLESHRHYLTDPNYSRERDLIAVTEDGTIAAFAFCWIDGPGNERNERREGWVNLLGVRRGHRKIGLGRAMLLAAIQKLKADGMAQAKLGVDAENPTGALQLYESVGFHAEQTWVQYLKSLE